MVDKPLAMLTLPQMNNEKIKAPWVGISSGVLTFFWAVERIIGLAGLREDLPWILNVATSIPPLVFYIAIVIFSAYAWARWGHYAVEIVKLFLGDPPNVILIIFFLGPFAIVLFGFTTSTVSDFFWLGYAVSEALKEWHLSSGSVTFFEVYRQSLQEVGLTLAQD